MSLLSSIGSNILIDANTNVVDYIIRILIACVCGFAVGYERKSRSKEAGIRTHSIVCMAACVMMIVSKYAFSDTDGVDEARIAAQVVSGIGFLGAGIIFYKRDMLHGLTTAAGVWATSGIGLAIGAGMVITGVCCTLLLVLIQVLLHGPWKILKESTPHAIRVTATLNGEDEIQKIQDIFSAKKILQFKTTQNGDKIDATIELVTSSKFDAISIYNIAKENPFINTIEKIDEA